MPGVREERLLDPPPVSTVASMHRQECRHCGIYYHFQLLILVPDPCGLLETYEDNFCIVRQIDITTKDLSRYLE